MTTETTATERFRIPTKGSAFALAAHHVIDTLSTSDILQRLEVSERALTPAELKRVDAAVAEVARRLHSMIRE